MRRLPAALGLLAAALALTACAGSSQPTPAGTFSPTASAPASSAPASVAPTTGAAGTCQPPASYGTTTMGRGGIYQGACQQWSGDVQYQESTEPGETPGAGANSWCGTYSLSFEQVNRPMAPLVAACRAGIAAAGGPAADAS